ncbi:cytochrome P450 76A2-like [Apium graveolens]|uniref:cytochrome P450 76A2-like n=1 Tax=Apium graveolens TaxID=4045 RepID=UPI003D7AB1F9
MEWMYNYVLCSIFLSLIWYLRQKNSYRRSKLPPGPEGWPVVGNIFDLGTLPHRGLAALKQKYGPVVWLNLGPVKTMVILSAGAAEELFKNHDLSFADRSINDAMRSHDFHKSSMALGAHSSYWRTLRRICTVELFSNKRINETALIRQKCVDEMLAWIEKEAKEGASGGIEVLKFVFPAAFNLIGNLTLSRDLVDPYSEMASEFKMALAGFSECLGRPNISDLFPWLRWLDLQGLRMRTDQDLAKAIQIISGFVHERVKERQQKERRPTEHKDFLDVVLDFEGSGKDEPAKLSDHQITIFLMEMFMAGTDTTSATIEWAMCELLQNPESMKKVKAELSRVVGVKNKLIESDIDNLPYLQATIEETLRLHAPVPLVLPRKAIQETVFMGYKIPKDTQVFVNAWAIGRDEESWEDALTFKPERFLGSSIGYKGQNFEFIPFGAGRRICPGIPLSHRTLPLILGSLLHHFDWELSENVSSEMKIDMTETMGLAAKKLKPLKAVPKRLTT